MKNTILLLCLLNTIILTGQVIDIDHCGNYLDPLKIGDQTWMGVNLNTDKFVNGDEILEAKSEKAWIEACNNKQPAWCYFENKSKNGKIYGKLYNWYAVNDPRGLAPKGWRIPTAQDVEKLNKKIWKTLSTEELEIIHNAFKKNFSGIRFDCDDPFLAGRFSTLNSSGNFDYCEWWTSNEINETKSFSFSSVINMTGIVDCNSEYNEGKNKGMGFPVRCILDISNK